MAEQGFSRSAFALAAMLVVVAGALSSSVVAAPATAVRCGDGDLMLLMDAVLGEDRPGGAFEVEGALAEFLRRDYPHLPASEFARAHDDANGTVLTYERNGAVRAAAHVERHGDSYYVTGFSACNSILGGGSDG